ncbi:hypothetical protein [Kitasatospora sp. NPDC097643]|uniref:hypothetical protein n=1 Tax=Kitasatospora sp. NPDC097643 TaxID=3157230 RepID=UPI00332F9801
MRSTRQVTVTTATTAAALLCLGALSACGPDNSADQAGGKTAAPTTATTAAPTGGAPTGGATTAAPTGGASKPAPGGGGKGIPAAAWMDTHSIPMDETYHWAPLAANAKPVTGVVTFKGQELCHATVAKDDETLFTGKAAAKAQVGFGGDHWMAQQTLLNFGDPGPSSGTKQLTTLSHSRLLDALKGCAKTAPGATVKVNSADDAPYFAAVMTIPQPDGSTVTLHEYVVDAGGTVSEMSVYVATKAGAQPKDAWKAPEDRYVGTGMTAPLCEALPTC